MQSILVTGGLGSFGSTLVKDLLENTNAKIFILDIATQPTLFSEKNLNRIIILKAGINDREMVDFACRNVDTVFHCCALLDTSKFGSMDKHKKINIEGTRLLIESCIKNNVDRLIYTSTHNVVFSGVPIDMADETYEYPQHTDFYSETKAKAEQLVLNANDSLLSNGKRFKTCALRAAAIWGKNDLHFGKIMKISKLGALITPNPDPHWNFVNINDLSKMHVLTAERLIEDDTMAGNAYFTGENLYCFEHYNRLLKAVGLREMKYPIPNIFWIFCGFFMELLSLLLMSVYDVKKLWFYFSLAEARKLTTSHTFNRDKFLRDSGFKSSLTYEEQIKETSLWWKQKLKI